MAYQRDPEISKAMRRMQQVNAFTLLSVAGVSGLGLAQSIYSYQQVEPKTYDVTEAHQGGGHDHVHMGQESRIPSTMGIISSGVTIATIGANVALNGYYGRKLSKRQILLREKVDSVIAHLKGGGDFLNIQPDLITLLGEEATEEFISFWQATHSGLRQ